MRTGVKWVIYHHSDALFTQFENAFLYEFSNYVCNYLFKVKEKKKRNRKVSFNVGKINERNLLNTV